MCGRIPSVESFGAVALLNGVDEGDAVRSGSKRVLSKITCVHPGISVHCKRPGVGGRCREQFSKKKLSLFSDRLLLYVCVIRFIANKF